LHQGAPLEKDQPGFGAVSICSALKEACSVADFPSELWRREGIAAYDSCFGSHCSPGSVGARRRRRPFWDL